MGKLRDFARARPKTAFILLLALLCGLALLASALITTERERVDRAIKAARLALQAGDVERTMRCVAPDFRQEGMDREGFRSFIARGLKRHGAPTVDIRQREYQLEGTTARCEMSVRSEFPGSPSLAGVPLLSAWRVSLRKIGSQWYITEVTPLKIEGHPVEGGLTGLSRQGMFEE
jgi:hypothetical protein